MHQTLDKFAALASPFLSAAAAAAAAPPTPARTLFSPGQGRVLCSRPGGAGAEHRGPGAQRRLAPQGMVSPAMRGYLFQSALPGPDINCILPNTQPPVRSLACGLPNFSRLYFPAPPLAEGEGDLAPVTPSAHAHLHMLLTMLGGGSYHAVACHSDAPSLSYLILLHAGLTTLFHYTCTGLSL